MKQLLHIKQNTFISHFILKITSGEISADERQGRVGGWANKQQRASQVRIHQGSQHIKTTSIASKVIL